MKNNLIIGLVLSFWSITTFGQMSLPEKTLLNLGFQDFITDIEKVKNLKSIEKLDEIEYQLKPYQKHIKLWTLFDEERYKAEFLYSLKKSFSNDELVKINLLLNHPFFVKVLKKQSFSRDVFQFLDNVKETDFKILNVSQDKLKLMRQIYKVHEYDLQNDQINKILTKYIQDNKIKREVSKSSGKSILISPLLMEKRLRGLKYFLRLYLAYDLREIKNFEIQEYLRILNKDQLNKKFATFLINYHFTYLKIFYEKVQK